MFAKAIMLACALSGLAPVAFAQSQEDARNELMRGILLDGNDQQIATGIKTGALKTGESYLLAPIVIDPNKDHVLIGSCSYACWELHMDLLDDKGRVLDLAKDNEHTISVEPHPVLRVLAGRSGNALRIRVTMVECDEQPCLWGVGAFVDGELQH